VVIVASDRPGKASDEKERIVAIDVDGNIHTKDSGSIWDDNIRQTTGRFYNLRLAQVKKFLFQARPYEWVEFKNVSLKPGTKTDVRVEVKGAGDAAIEKSSNVDLVIENFDIDPYPEGGLYSVTVSIRNKGSKSLPEFRLNFYCGDPAKNLDLHGKPQTGSNGAGPIKPGDVWNESSMPFALKGGLNEISVILDPKGDIFESDKTSRTAVLNVTVKDGKIVEKSLKIGSSYKPNSKTDVQIRTGEQLSSGTGEEIIKAAEFGEANRAVGRTHKVRKTPVVIKTVPAAFVDDVSAELDKITVTFDQPMMDESWSWTGGGETFPKITDKIYYDSSRTTCTLPVKLEAGKVYWVGINSPSYKAFQTIGRVPAKRYVILFATKNADGTPTPIPADMLAEAKAINEQAGKTRKEQTGDTVEQAVMTISTCAENDPKVEKSLDSLKGLDEEAVVRELVKFLDSDKNTVRRSAIYILWKGDFKNIEPAVASLKKLCSHEEELTRGMAAITLGGCKVESSFDTICSMTLNDSSGYARRCAAYALGLMGRPDAKPVLEKALKDTDPLVRNSAEAALTMISQAEKSSEGEESISNESLAVEAAQDWLKLIDDGDYGKSWDEAAEIFKSAVSKEQWENSVKAVRVPLGKVISREVKSKTYTRQLPGAPDGEYVVIEFATSFENKKEAVETVTPMKDKDGNWRVSGYYIR
jgi:hypothetical protein